LQQARCRDPLVACTGGVERGGRRGTDGCRTSLFARIGSIVAGRFECTLVAGFVCQRLLISELSNRFDAATG